MAVSGRRAVVAALLVSISLTVIKFVAFVFSGSSALLSEAIHSAADSGNQGLLYLGIRRSEKPPDAMFPYGYGTERFFFALLAAVGIFILGCGVTLYHGVHSLLSPPKLELSWWTFAVLGVSFVAEAYVLVLAVRAVYKDKGDQPFWRYARTTSDPTVLAVLFEDSIACIGVVVAFAGIGLAHLTGSAVYDTVSSIVIGLLMGVMATWLAARNRQLIIGMAIPGEVESAVVAFLRAQPSVTSVRDIKTRVIGAGRFKLKAEVDYDGGHLAAEHMAWVRENLPDPEDDEAVRKFAVEFGDRICDTLAREIDRIESEIARRFPALQHVDLESDLLGEEDSTRSTDG
jgi:zinc transporter 9